MRRPPGNHYRICSGLPGHVREMHHSPATTTEYVVVSRDICGKCTIPSTIAASPSDTLLPFVSICVLMGVSILAGKEHMCRKHVH